MTSLLIPPNARIAEILNYRRSTFLSLPNMTILRIGKDRDTHSAIQSTDTCLYFLCFSFLEECTLAAWIVKADTN